MPHRSRLFLALLAALVAAAIWVPATPWVRDRAVGALVDVAAAAGYRIELSGSTGNLWRGVALRDVVVSGAGVELEAGRLAVSWFAPALVVGELPLQIEVRDAEGDVRWTDLEPPPGGGGGTPVVRPRLDAIRIDGGALRLSDIPFTLPDIAIERVDATTLPNGRFRLELGVRTPDGAAEGSIVAAWGSSDVAVRVDRADATIARAWWDGVEGGTVAGDLRWTEVGADGSFELADGAVRAFGAHAVDVHGPVVWRGDLIESALVGTALGGRIGATAVVDLAASTWRAVGDVDVELVPASATLTAFLGAPSLPPADRGRVTGEVAFHGWTDVWVDGVLDVDGAWLGAPIAVPGLALAYDPDRGLDLDASGTWGEGPLRLRAEPGTARLDWTVAAGPVEVLGVPVEAATAAFTTGQGPLVGRAEARAGADAWQLAVDAVVDAEGLQGFVQGSLLGTPFEGALVAPTLAAAADLEGRVAWRPDPDLWTGAPAVSLTLDGVLGRPTGRAVVDGEGAVAPRAIAPYVAQLDLRGAVDLVLGDGGLSVAGRLGPVELRGGVRALEAVLVDPLALAGPLAGSIGPAGATVRSGALEANGVATVAATAGADLGLEQPIVASAGSVPWRLRFDAAGWALDADEGRWSAALPAGEPWRIDVVDGRLRLGAREASVTASGDAGTGAGTVAVAAGALVADAAWSDGALSAEVRSREQTLRVAIDAEGVATAVGGLDLATWSDLGGLVLAGRANVDGRWLPGADAPEGRIEVDLGAPFEARARLAGDGTALTATLDADALGFEVRADGRWNVAADAGPSGQVHLGPFGPIAWSGAEASGAGTVPPVRWGAVVVPELAWRASADASGAVLTWGGLAIRYDGAAGRLSAELDQEVAWGGAPARISGDARWSAAEPDGAVSVELDLGDGASARAEGDATGLSGSLDGSAARWAAGATPLLAADGAAALAGTLDAAFAWSPAADPLASAEVAWLDGASQLVDAVLAWGPDGLTWTLSGDDWDARGSAAAAAWSGRGARLDRLLADAPATVRADGELTYAAGTGWSGAANGTLRLPDRDDLTVDWLATGDGALRLAADGRLGPASARAEGSWPTSGAAEGTWELDASELASGTGSWRAGPEGASLDGALDVGAGSAGPVAWPGFGVDVAWTPEGDPDIVARGALLAVEGDRWRLPLEAFERPATLTASFASGVARLAFDHPLGAAEVGGSLDAWEATGWAMPLEGVDARLEASVRGSGAAADGAWSVGGAAATWAAGLVTVEGTEVRATLPGTAIDPSVAPFWPAGWVATGDGELTLRAGVSGWSLDGGLGFATGTDALPIAVEIRADERSADVALATTALDGVGVRAAIDDLATVVRDGAALSGSFGERPLAGSVRPAADGWSLALTAGEADAPAWSATARLAEVGELRLRAHDPWTGAATASWSLGERSASLDAEAVGVELSVRLAPDEGGSLQLELDAHAPAADAALRLAGSAAPLDLTGTLVALGGAPAPARATADPAWRFAWGGLEATWAEGALVLDGQTAEDQLPAITLRADALAFHPTDGWSGSGQVVTAAGRYAADAELRGAGALTAEVTARVGNQAIGGGTVVVPTTVDGAWSGRVALEAPLTRLLGWTVDDATVLSAAGVVGGRGPVPQLDLALALSGRVPAHGRAEWDGTEARIDLIGQGLSASGSWSAERGGLAVVELQDVDASDVLPMLADPRIDLRVDARTRAGVANLRIDVARLRTAASELVGQGSLADDGTLSASLRLDADLADVRGVPGLHGRVAGPVAYTGPVADLAAGALTARLDVEGVTWGALGARVDGEVLATGDAGDPTLRAAWRAAGDGVALAGSAAWRPAVAPMAELQAIGRASGLDVDVALSSVGGAITGGGRISGPTGFVLLTDGGGVLRADGADGWSGWSAILDPAAGSLSLEGDLDAWPNGAGRVAATARLDPTPNVVARAEDLALAGIAIGDLVLEGDLEDGWRLAGEHVAGTAALDLSGFEVRADAVPLPGGTAVVDGTWSRDAAGDAIAARVHGEVSAGPVDLSATLAGFLADGALRGLVEGTVLGGTATWPVARTADGWDGTGRLVGAEVGAARFDATVQLSGVGIVPEVEVAVADPAGGWQVDAGWLEGRALVTARARAPDGTFALRGRAWPDLDVVLDDGRGGTARVHGGWSDAALRIEGEADFAWGPVRLEVAGPDRLRVRVAGIDGGWSTALPPRSALDLWRSVRDDGLSWNGDGAWGGRIDAGRADYALLRLERASVRYQGATLVLDGSLDVGAATLGWRIDAPAAPAELAELEGLLEWDGADLTLRSEALGHATLTRDARVERTGWSVDVAAAGGRIAGELVWTEAGWSGGISADGVVVPIAGGATLELEVRGDGAVLAIDGALRARRGAVTADGRWDGAALRLGSWGPAPTGRRDIDLRANGIDLGGLGGARALDGVVAGSVAVRGDLVVGQFAAEPLVFGGASVPASLALQGDLADGPSGTVRLDLDASHAIVDLDAAGVSLFVQMQRFLLHDAVAAAFGASDVIAQVTGALRGTWSWGASRPHDLRLATEHVRLERAGIVTTGNVALSWDGVSLRVGEAAFEGSGAWRAAGSATPEAIDLELVATDADFSPLLGLVPSLARFAVTAVGDLSVRATGTLSEPDVVAEATALELGVAGTRYRLEDVRGDLTGAAWSVRAGVAGVAPLGGRVALVAGGRIGPFPETGFSLDARAVGDLDVPLLGRVADLVAELRWSDTEPATIEATGRVGGPLVVSGTLTPLDVRVRGTGLDVAVPFLFVADATADADARILADGAGVLISGRLDASQARIDLASRTTVEAGTAAAPATGASADAASVQAARERVRFDGIRIVAPQRVTIAESFANADAAVDLTLDGNAAAPRLTGTVAALRGTLRFAGRDLELTEALATFDPARGVFPTLRIAGRTSFDKARVVPPGLAVRFTAPPGPRFTVDVALAGEATNEGGTFALDLEPQLESDALVEGLDGGLGARALTDLELLTLVALGRLEVTSGFAGAVAQNALDAAVDLLVTAEIQAALAETLGIDVVELRTSPLTGLLDGSDPFGVSLRLGGYLSDEVFASYRVSTLDGEGAGAFSNEVSFAYQLGPVALDVTGRVDVAAGSTATTGPSLAVGASYGFGSGWSLAFGVDLSTERSLARLGVTWRW
ncbi:MAG: translocation/assembly module TamB domain-containing protein [Trueperaceae bacterium]